MDKYIAIVGIMLGVQTSIIVSEPICSKYDYDEKTLQKLIRLEFKFERLMDDLESFKSEWKNVKSDVNTKIESMSTLLNGVNEKMTTEFEESKNRKIEMEQLTTRLTKVESSREVIAFSATNLKDLTSANGQTLIFTDIDFNIDGGYNVNTGIFTAPVGGLYLFMTHVCNHGGKYAVYAVIIDGTEVLRSAQSDDKHYSCHSIPVVTHVRSGGEVKVQNMYSSSRFYQDSERRLMFSGVLLNQD